MVRFPLYGRQRAYDRVKTPKKSALNEQNQENEKERIVDDSVNRDVNDLM